MAVCSEKTGTVPGNCCCDRCNSTTLRCHPCCGCIPSRLCATLSSAEDASSYGALMIPDENGDYGTVTLAGSLVTGCSHSLTVSVSLDVDEYGDCLGWHIVVPEIGVDEYIDPASYAGGECENPVFTYAVNTAYCAGTLVIQRDEQETLEYVDTYDGCKDYYCSSCRCVCRLVCFQDAIYEWSGGGWTNDDALGTITLSRSEAGNCVFTVPGYDPVEVLATHQCGAAMSVPIGPYGDTLVCTGCRCDDGCADVCVSHGESFGPCAGTYSLFYFLSALGGLTNGNPLCCALPTTELIRDPSECKWCVETGCGTWCFDATADPLVVTLTTDAGTWTWEAIGPVDPLCTIRFLLSDSPAGQTCAVYSQLCLTPGNGCCDNGNFRDTVLPDTLHVAGEHCCNDPGEQPVPFAFEIVWNTSEGRWEGSTTICGSTLTLWITCGCGLFGGCGTAEDPCYSYSLFFDDCLGGGDVLRAGTIPDCACSPFELAFSVASIFSNCCPAENIIDLDLVVTE